eukprot:GFUD01000334.1.p1 GENE.GFUD01000334.1~~GFUD01000334.1.p1  ORF type:complete len:305 (-),score=94.85 GFUD01000334.1:104-1018(-)
MDADTMEELPHVHSSWCLLISTLILALTAITTSALRSVVRYSFPPTLSAHCLLDLLCGLELCVCGFELGVILDIYDVPLYSFFLWTVLVWQAISWGDATANPYSHLLRWQAGTQPAVQAVVRVAAGAAGALSSYMMLAPLWKYELSHFHQGRADRSATGSCGDDLQVSMISGTLVELLGTLLCFLSGFLLSDLPQLKTKPLLITCLDNAVGVALVIAAFDLTGGYFNPALALGIKLGCGRGGHLQHMAVYWLGPCVGAIMAAPLYNGAKAVFAPENARDKKIKKLAQKVEQQKKEEIVEDKKTK